MANVFQFSAPNIPTSTNTPRYSLRARPKITKKRRTTAADMLNHRACVAHYEEPVFCPNDTSTVYIPGSLFHSVARSEDTHLPIPLDEDYDDEDEETGGVPLPFTEDPQDADELMTGTYVEDGLGTTNATAHEDQTSPYTPISAASTPRRLSHPRPVHNDDSEDVNARRTRFALEGDSTQREAYFAVQLGPGVMEGSSAPPRHAPSQANSISGRNELLRRNSSQTSFRAAQQSQAHESAPIETNPAHDATPEELHLFEMDEDALAVDDPRRLYDFADFMDTWRLRSMRDNRLPRSEPGLQASIRLSRPTQEVTQAHLNTGNVDMQGIRWQLIGPSRANAAIARAMLHQTDPGTSYWHPQSYVRPPTVVTEDRHYRFRSFAPRHRAKFSHYQLRHVLAANNRNQIFYATGFEVKRASLACPTTVDTVMDLANPGNSATPFRITCLAAPPNLCVTERENGVLLAGGFYGEYALLNTNNGSKYTQGFVTHAYNGLVTHIHGYQDRRSGLLQAAFCSNDRKVRLMDVGSMTFTATHKYDYAINCAATSPDGRLRVLVGDSSETLITDAERGQAVVTLDKQTDHGFACAWSQDGRYVATGTQDGNTVVWDARNWSSPLRHLPSALSCARSLNFTDTGALVVAENEDVVRVYDQGNFKVCQELRFFGSIAGVALMDGGAEIAIANADKTVGGLLTFERSSRGMAQGSYRAKTTLFDSNRQEFRV